VHTRFLSRSSGVFLFKTLLVAALVLGVCPSFLAGASSPEKTVSIAVGCEGSWKLRYKIYYHEIADSETRELSGIGKRVVDVRADRELVNLCAWLTPTGAREEREKPSLSIVVQDGKEKIERQAPRSPFSSTSSVCFHF
jgi:hypothetical protein